MIIFSYIRVSGKGQVDGDGPERQRESIRAFCQKHILAPLPPAEFFEKAVSGTVDAMDRPEFARMIDAIEALPEGAYRCIVVERMDRLARDLMISEFLLAECRKRNIPVYSADQNDLRDMASDGADPTRVLLRQILGALAQWEKSALVLKLRKARDRKRALTGRCEGPLPFGTSPKELAILNTMRAFREEQKVSFSGIADWANRLGFLTRAGKRWTKHSVYQVIERQKNPAKAV